VNTETYLELRNISDKIATEVVFAKPGEDVGLLPINCMLAQIEEILAKQAAPEPLPQAAQQARRWLDEIFESTGTFSALNIERLGEWVTWWQTATQAGENQTSLPALPENWATAPAAPAAPVAAPAPPCATTGPQEEPVLMLNLEEDRELIAEFVNEGQEHLQNIEQGVLVLEDNPTDADTLNSIFRAFHTFKGGSGFLNLTAIQTLAHELESLLDLARQGKLAITPPVIDVILGGGDTLKQFVAEIAAQLAGAKPRAAIQVPTRRLIANIRAVLEGKAATKTASPAAEGAQRPENPKTGRLNTAGTAVKVDTNKLDSLVDLVGEMVIAQSLVVESRDLNSLRSEQLNRDLAHLGRISKDLQRTAMSLRMVPIRATFQKMNRLVRDVTAKVGKQVELVTQGEDTELDRTIVEQINDPLIHMLRNSIDHGIEKPEVRQQHGKPARGQVSLKAFHQGGNIVIEIMDDGNGLDRERILAKGIEKGLVQPGQHLSDAEVFDLIMKPGFSTADKITDLSGRGVGLDVVRRNIEKLRGKIEIQSTAGQGSTFRLFLPLTMAIIDGLIVGIGEHRYIVPTLSVRESFRPAAEMIKTVQARGEMIEVHGRLLPLLRLYAHLGIQTALTDPARSIVVVVEAGNNARCVMVDQLLGKQEVVIKTLGETFRQNHYIAGAAILGDGRVGLILDPQSLVYLDSTLMEAAA
jgi:two-component system chemotaxis sensor kinase CheA